MKHDANLEWSFEAERQISVDMTILNRPEVSKLGDFGARWNHGGMAQVVS
jgi:hypothetical protein